MYPGLWVYERPLLSEVLLLLEVALMILLAYRFRDRPSGRAVGLGAMCGLLALTRSEQILVLPLLVFPLILAAKEVDRRRRVALDGRWPLATSLVVVAPWTIFNLGRFQRPVLLSNGFGAAAATGNCS